MSRRWTGLLALLAVFVLGAGAAALATARSRGSTHAAHSQRTMTATGATGATASAAAAGKKSTTMTRLEAPLTIQPGATEGSDGRCPKRAPKAVSGYWGTDEPNRDGDLVVVRSTPVLSGTRSWEVALKNTSLTPITAYVGTVCIK
jgi:hypothetical protein